MSDHETCWFDSESEGDKREIVSASKIHLIGLDKIKERLGAKWDRMSHLVHRYFEAAIRREMRPGDTFCHSGELSYLILFRDTTIAETQLKCSVVVEDVCRRLFGEEGEDISVRSLIAPTDAMGLGSADEQARLDTLLERDGREVLFENRFGTVTTNTSPLLRVRIGAAPDTIHTIDRNKPIFVYRPLWDTTRNVVLTYICQILPDTMRPSMPFSAPCVATEGEEEQCMLDIMALQECLRRATRMRRAGLRVLLATPLHFTTLSRARFWSRVNAVVNAEPKEILRDVAFVVHGFDAGIPNIRLVQELPKLNRFSKFMFCLVGEDEGAGLQFQNTGTHALGLALHPGQSQRYWIERMKKLSRRARENAMDTFALGAASRSAAINAIGAGMRYLEGAAVRTTVADPKHAFVQEVEDLYRDARSAG